MGILPPAGRIGLMDVLVWRAQFFPVGEILQYLYWEMKMHWEWNESGNRKYDVIKYE
jgi:hypothetical protein